MNPAIIFHLARTELRRVIWLAAIYWLALFFISEIESVILVGSLLMAWIAQGDHWTRSTAQWRARPVSEKDWAASRILLLITLVVLPVAIQQFWIFARVGFEPAVSALGAFEGSMSMLLVFSVVFVTASFADTWPGVVGVVLAAVLILQSLSLLIFRIFDPAAANMALWWIYLIGIIAICAVVMTLLRRIETKVTRVILLIGLMFIAALAQASVGFSKPDISTNTLGKRLTLIETEGDATETPGQQPVARGLAIAGLEETEFFEYVKPPEDQEGMAGWSFLQSFASRVSLLRALPEDRLYLQPYGQLMKLPTKQKYLPVFPTDETGKSEIKGRVFRYEEIAQLPFIEGFASRTEGFHFQLAEMKEDGERTTRDIEVRIAFPNLEIASGPNSGKSEVRSRSSGRWKVVADHPKLGETILLTEAYTDNKNRQISFSAISTST